MSYHVVCSDEIVRRAGRNPDRASGWDVREAAEIMAGLLGSMPCAQDCPGGSHFVDQGLLLPAPRDDSGTAPGHGIGIGGESNE